MANEKRLIDANALIERLKFKKSISEVGLYRGLQSAMSQVEKASTVDAVVLPCKIGDDVYIIPSKVNFDLNVLAGHNENNRIYHQKVAEIVFNQNGWYMRGSLDKEYGADRILVDRFYNETWFLTEKEAEAVLAKMDGDGNG